MSSLGSVDTSGLLLDFVFINILNLVVYTNCIVNGLYYFDLCTCYHSLSGKLCIVGAYSETAVSMQF